MKMDDAARIEALAYDVMASKKYRHLDPQLVERVAGQMLQRYSKHKDALKAVKNELHRINESFLHDDCHKKAYALLNAAKAPILSDAALSQSIMALHASTYERLPEVEAIYAYIGSYVNEQSVVMDIGCGFNPFALALYQALPQAYWAYDINGETIDLLNAYFVGVQKDAYQASLLDAAVRTPSQRADVAFLFKLLPLLQQQQKGRAKSLLEALDSALVLVSFPTKSLSGREKGMEVHYTAFLETCLPSAYRIVDQKGFANEIFFALRRTT